MPCEETRIARAIFSRHPASLRKCCPSFCLAISEGSASLPAVSQRVVWWADWSKNLCETMAGSTGARIFGLLPIP